MSEWSRRFLRIQTRAVGARLRADESGTTTVSFVLWLPVFMMVLAMVADGSLAFGKRSNILRVIQDTNRAVSVGRITDLEEAKTQIKQKLASIAPSAEVATVVQSGVIISTVTVPLIELTSLGLLSRLIDGNVVVSSQHLSEG